MNEIKENRIKRIYNTILSLVQDGFFHILLGNVLIKIVAFVSSVGVIRIITKSEYGYLSYSDTLFNYITLLSGLGLSTALLKFCSSEKDVGINAYYLNISVKYGCFFQFLLSIIFAAYALLKDIEFEEAKPIIFLLVLYPTGTYLVSAMQSFIRSQLNNKLFAKMGVVQTFSSFVTSITLSLVIGVKGVIIARYISVIIVLRIGYKYIRKVIPKGTKIIPVSTEEKKLFWRIAISLMLANLFSMIMPINESYMISKMMKSEIILANYKIATLIPSQILFITSSVIVYAFPKVTLLCDKKQDAFKYIFKINLLLVAIISMISIIGVLFSDIIIKLVYGSAYADAGSLSKIYWIAYGINAAFRMLPMSLLPAFGITTANFIISIVFCGIHISLLSFMIPKFGMLGAAYTSVIIYIVSGFVYWILLYFWNKKFSRR